MQSDKGKKIINVIVWIVVIATVILMIINAIIQISENKRIARWENEQQKILDDAILNLNTSRCTDYIKYPIGCAIIIAMKTSLESCELINEPEYWVRACKSAASNNLIYCSNLDKYDKWVCEEIAQSAINKLKNEN